ncbi:hypothetical protein ACHAW6_006011, partial [Cyclotella cf. meneghiniana]
HNNFCSHLVPSVWYCIIAIILSPTKICSLLPSLVTINPHSRTTMSDDNNDAKPEGEGSEQLTIRVKDQSGEETFFKVKKTTKMSKIFNAYATRKGLDPSSIRFLLDGDNIDPNQTPKMLELEDQDQIDCVLEQVGGRCL